MSGSRPDREDTRISLHEADALPASDALLIPETATLHDAIRRLNVCETGLTVFATDVDGAVTGALSRGDVLRFLERTSVDIDWRQCYVSQAMTPRVRGNSQRLPMLFIDATSINSWFEQVSEIRARHKSRWRRIKLLPVLDKKHKLLNVLDLESPRTRARIETIVMASAFPLERNTNAEITDTSLANRRLEFDSIHYGTHWQKVRGLCDILLERKGGTSPMLHDVFNRARADEIVHGLWRYEEWLLGHLPATGMTKIEHDKLREQIKAARAGLARRYQDAAASNYFPVAPEKVAYELPELVIILGCRPENKLRERVEAALDVVRRSKGAPPTLVLSGGGDGHAQSEAQRMMEHLQRSEPDIRPQQKRGWSTLVLGERSIDVVLEEDSLDTLGNAVFTWLTLKMEGDRYGLTSASTHRLERIVLVTDAIHAPRAHDIFRRVFAFRSQDQSGDGPIIVVRTVKTDASIAEAGSSALEHLRSEATANNEIFRLVNPLTNGFDVIADGHVRSILGQMLRLHKLYSNRWDLVRKYHRCWSKQDRKDETA